MQLFRITRDKYSKSLTASGVGARWNSDDVFVIYTSGTRSLATLEVLVNTNRVALLRSYKLMCLDLDAKSKDIHTVNERDLPKNWRGQGAYKTLRSLGNEWYYSKKKLVLKVPSAVIPQEHNFIINTRHPDFFDKLSLSHTEEFIWDKRLINS